MKRNLSNYPEYVRGYLDGRRNQGAIARHVIDNPKYLRGYLDGQLKRQEERWRSHPRVQVLSFLLILIGLLGLGYWGARAEQVQPTGQAQQKTILPER